MSIETTSDDERKDLKLREELQTKLQSAIRRSASRSELSKIEGEISKLNQKLEQRTNRLKRA